MNLENRLTLERFVLKQGKTALEKLVPHDILIGIYNRHFFKDQLYAYGDQKKQPDSINSNVY